MVTHLAPAIVTENHTPPGEERQRVYDDCGKMGKGQIGQIGGEKEKQEKSDQVGSREVTHLLEP